MTQSAGSLPFSVTSDPFEKKLRGVYGRFKTTESYPLEYVLSSIPIDQIEDLRTAAEEFRVRDISFDQMIQRDIDQHRVREIASEYLEQGAGKVLFFPPLLLSVVVKDGDGSIRERYSTVDHDLPGPDKPELVITWDKDKFRLILPTETGQSGLRSIRVKGSDYSFYEFGAQLHYNPRQVKIIVLDGQHRLEALRLLYRNPQKRALVASIEIPVCIVFTPDAMEGRQESVTRDLRNLFVTVNNRGKQVSGHFIVLLKDDSLAAETIRQLATAWKEDTSEGYTFLHHLEWNQREDRRTNQVNRAFGITTVGIVNETLAANLFEKKYGYSLLNLASCEAEITAADQTFSPTELNDSNWPHSIREILRKQIVAELVPALGTLFREPLPYRRTQAAFKQALAKLDQKVAENLPAFVQLKDRLEKHQYTDRELREEHPATAEALEQFETWVGLEDERSPYFMLVFQQALLRVWISVASQLKLEGISPVHTARALVAGLDCLCTAPERAFFSPQRAYTSRTLYNGEKIIQAVKAREAWFALVLATLLHEPSRRALIEKLSALEELTPERRHSFNEKLEVAGREAAHSFLETYFDETEKEIRKRYSDMGYPEGTVQELRALEASERPEDNELFAEKVRLLAEERLKHARRELANKLEVKVEVLKAMG